MIKLKTNQILLILLSLVILSSCVPSKKLLYVQQTDDAEPRNNFVNIKTARKILPTDELYIKVLSTDDKTSSIMSREGSIDSRNYVNIALISYRVSETGTIEFPFIGEIYLKDLTIDEARKKILDELKSYMKNASLIIKFVNNRVTVIGEVNKPGEYQYFHEQISIFRALGMAGGMTGFGNKKEVILIRETDNSLQYNYLNLTNKNIVGSEFYYILPNDIIIVNPIKAKFWTMTSFNWGTLLSAITTGLSLLYYFNSN